MTVDLDMTCRGTWKGLFWLSPSSLFHFFSKETSILHLYSSVYSILFRAGLRHEGLRSAQRLNNIPPNFITSVRSNFRKGNYHGFGTSTMCRQYATHRQNKFFTPSTCINSLHTFLSSTQILRSAMMFLYLLVSSLSRDYVRHVFFGDGREHTKKVSFSFLKISRCNLDSNCYVCNHFSVNR